MPTRQNIADSLTKKMSSGDPAVVYLGTVLDSGLWTLGPDPRAPVDGRNRNVVQEWLKQAAALGEDDMTAEQENYIDVINYFGKKQLLLTNPSRRRAKAKKQQAS